jgi:uncharacterized protein YigA (DUF484 family)
MKTHEFSFNSQADLTRQIKNFERQRPGVKLDQTQVNIARARASKMDNNRKLMTQRAVFEIAYTESRAPN